MVILCGSKSLEEIEYQLNEDLKNLRVWLEENELLLNMKPGKTEVLLFGTSKRIATTNRNLEVKFMEKPINVTGTYKYLGVEIDQSLNLNSHFDKIFYYYYYY